MHARPNLVHLDAVRAHAHRVRLSRLAEEAPRVASAEFHVRRAAREAFDIPSSLFSARGDVIFARSRDAFELAERLAQCTTLPPVIVRPAELHAMGLVHEVLHAVVSLYRRNAGSIFGGLLETLRARLGADLERTLLELVEELPPPTVFRREETPQAFLARSTDGISHAEWALEELLLLWISNANPAYGPIAPLISDASLREKTRYLEVVEIARGQLDLAPRFGPDGETLFDLLVSPMRLAPHSIFAQLEHMRARWGLELQGLGLLDRLLRALDVLREQDMGFEKRRWGAGGPPNIEPPSFRGDLYALETEKFSPDLDWMPRVVMIAKSTFVWLDQLSKAYRAPIRTLADIPELELEILASRGFTALWLIGVWRRSAASQRIKRMQGNVEALASAYSLHEYEVAPELGGPEALATLKARAERHGIRLASDMVPNHMGLDSAWVNAHPEWFIQTNVPPYPAYRFEGTDLGSDPRVGVYLEDGYWTRSDAAVVFKRVDRATGEARFIYHGNDGTSMPWNDTAQLDYLRADVREAVIQTILHVARQFPIIRFDAAMTLAQRHYQRLWYPTPGTGGSVPSRADHALSKAEFEARYPVEFWREVVDRVAAEVPNTLLLAEAFWLMEGYFVRTLGMHRVYNSAFMNMLKREENASYRLTIRNVLEFNPQILKRFVNFMNNPDEEPAVVQFGKEGKYFGVSVLLSTMPGLPMFGHGQIEGFGEKYGMEFARAQWSEEPDPWLVARHEREIFPLLARRALFSEVDNFLLYDFVTPEGHVDENVFAYSNRRGGERALVVFHNKYQRTRGRIRTSVGFADGSGAIVSRTLAFGLALSTSPRHFLVMREHMSGLEYLRSTEELSEEGLSLELEAFEYRVFWELREVVHTSDRPYADLSRALDGRGVPSIERALLEHCFRAVHVPFLEAVNAGSARWLSSRADAEPEEPRPALPTVEEKLGNLVDGLRWMATSGIFAGQGRRTEVPWKAVAERTAARLARGAAAIRDLAEAAGTHDVPASSRLDARFVADFDEVGPEQLVAAWCFLEAVAALDAMSRGERSPDSSPVPRADDALRTFHLGSMLERAFREGGASEAAAARGAQRLALLAALARGDAPYDVHEGARPAAFRPEEARARPSSTRSIDAVRPAEVSASFGPLARLLRSPDTADALEVHAWDGTRWLSKERYQALVSTRAILSALDGTGDSMRDNLAEAARAMALGERSGWRFDVLLGLVESAPEAS